MTDQPRAAAVDPLDLGITKLTQFGRPDIADRVREISGRPPPPRSLVVVGEVKRGKSSLVNSLLQQRDLATVDTEISTATAVRYRPASPDRPAGTAHLIIPGAEPRPIDVAEVADWVTVNGSHAGDSVDGMIPVAAEIYIDTGLLTDVTIIDTPGVNGLDPQHVEATMRATDGACGLVMVCDALAPITRPELNFLASISREVGTVFLAVTKVDKAPVTWRKIVEANQELLRRHAPQFAHVQILGISNLLSRNALDAGDEGTAATMLTASGVLTLVESIDRALGSPEQMVRRNALQCASVALLDMRRQLAMEFRTVSDAPRIHREMTEENERVQQLLAERPEWRTRLNQRLGRLQSEIESHVKAGCDAIQHRWEETADSSGVMTLARGANGFVARISDELDALTNDVAHSLQQDLAAVTVEMLDEATPLMDTLDGLDQLDLRPKREYSQWKGFFDPQLMSLGLSGHSLTVLAASIPFLAGAPAALVIMPAWGAMMVGFRAKRHGQTSLKRWLTDAIRQTREDTMTAVRTIINTEFAPELQVLYLRALEESIERTRRLIDEAAVAAKSSQADRAKELAAIKARIGDLDRAVTTVTAAMKTA